MKQWYALYVSLYSNTITTKALNINCSVVGNNIVDHADVGVILDLTPDFNGLGQ